MKKKLKKSHMLPCYRPQPLSLSPTHQPIFLLEALFLSLLGEYKICNTLCSEIAPSKWERAKVSIFRVKTVTPPKLTLSFTICRCFKQMIFKYLRSTNTHLRSSSSIQIYCLKTQLFSILTNNIVVINCSIKNVFCVRYVIRWPWIQTELLNTKTNQQNESLTNSIILHSKGNSLPRLVLANTKRLLGQTYPQVLKFTWMYVHVCTYV